MVSSTRLSVVLCGVSLCATGCATSGYRMIALREITTVETERGESVQVRTSQYVAFHEDIERSPNVKSATRMTDFEGERQPGDFTLSPDGGVLVYQALENTSTPAYSNLWRISTAGAGGTTRLTAGNYLDADPAFAADGKHIYFSSNRISQNSKIWRVKTDGAGGIACITQGNSVDRWPCAATGDYVYFTSRPANASANQIWRISAAGSLPTQLKEGIRPELSPDGQRILYCTTDPGTGKSSIWVMNVDGTHPTQMSSDSDVDDREPSWSMDGRSIVFASDAGKDSNGRKNFDIWMMNADGSERRLLTTNGSTDFKPRMSPDGRYIYFLSNRAFNWNIWRIEILGQPSR